MVESRRNRCDCINLGAMFRYVGDGRANSGWPIIFPVEHLVRTSLNGVDPSTYALRDLYIGKWLYVLVSVVSVFAHIVE